MWFYIPDIAIKTLGQKIPNIVEPSTDNKSGLKLVLYKAHTRPAMFIHPHGKTIDSIQMNGVINNMSMSESIGYQSMFGLGTYVIFQ